MRTTAIGFLIVMAVCGVARAQPPAGRQGGTATGRRGGETATVILQQAPADHAVPISKE